GIWVRIEDPPPPCPVDDNHPERYCWWFEAEQWVKQEGPPRFPPCPVGRDHPDRYRWILDGREWVKLGPAAARRMEYYRQHPIPAGQISFAAELPRQLELAELDSMRDKLFEAGEARGRQ